ncbi:MAG TPA: GNAT family N-acetyltransferase [Ohtaekwangia sp.]|nr:GNAT family N-acetyltransferase [Ohtaekwangia sp.]
MEVTLESTVSGFTYSTDRTRLDIEYIHRYLKEKSYWAQGIPREVVVRGIENAMCFGVYDTTRQVGFARVITDYATFGYLADVFIDEAYRGRGLSKTLMQVIMGAEVLSSLRRLVLVTRDAHTLYSRFDFKPLKNPDGYMEMHRPDIYKKPSTV